MASTASSRQHTTLNLRSSYFQDSSERSTFAASCQIEPSVLLQPLPGEDGGVDVDAREAVVRDEAVAVDELLPAAAAAVAPALAEGPVDGLCRGRGEAQHDAPAAHGPREVPQATLDKFAFIDWAARRTYHALVAYLDGLVGEMVATLTNADMWDETLMVFSSGESRRSAPCRLL